MKLKFRVIIFGVIGFIFFISFKIMEPELKDHPGNHRNHGDALHDNKGAAPVEVETHRAEIRQRIEEDEEQNKEKEYRGKEEEDEDEEEDTEDEEDEDFKSDHKQTDIARRVQHLLDLYDVDWSASFHGDLWKTAAGWVNSRRVHPEHAPEMGAILQKLTKARIIKAGLGYRGTQIKMLLYLEGGQRVAFKPQWFERDHVIKGKPYDGNDRHNGEIASFHLNRLLGFARAPLSVGRVVDMETEIRPVAHENLLKTFFTNGSNSCFYGKCYYCKGPETGICGRGTKMEGMISLWLPDQWKLQVDRSPWSRTYRDDKQAEWETAGPEFCTRVRRSPPFDDITRVLDFVDVAVHDYLIGNADAHHYDTYKGVKDSVVLLMDRAKSFGNPDVDELTILAPLYQCCIIRQSTWSRLLYLQDGVLSVVLQQLLSHDAIAPVLAEPHYEAIDRRLETIVEAVELCIEQRGEKTVIVRDQFTDTQGNQ